MLKFENGEKSCEFENDSVILHDVIKSLGLDGKKIIAAKLNGEAMDLSRFVSTDGSSFNGSGNRKIISRNTFRNRSGG